MVLEQIRDWVRCSERIVFFGGAGVSTASGIPDFRSQTGLYNQQHHKNFSPEYMLSHEFMTQYPEDFYQYIKKNLIVDHVKPNPAHTALYQLEKRGKLLGIVTQNIDGLHSDAGNTKICELHGTLKRYYCPFCKKEFSLAYYQKSNRCTVCQRAIRPDIVLYGECLDQKVLAQAIRWISEADLLIVGGTSLVVYPAAGLLDYYRGNHLALINMDRTPKDDLADLVYYGDIATAMEFIIGEINEK